MISDEGNHSLTLITGILILLVGMLFTMQIAFGQTDETTLNWNQILGLIGLSGLISGGGIRKPILRFKPF
jgi:hypothetical protein